MKNKDSFYCVDVASTSYLMGLHRQSVWYYMRLGVLRYHYYSSYCLVFLSDVSKLTGKTEDELINQLKVAGLPIWTCWKVDDDEPGSL